MILLRLFFVIVGRDYIYSLWARGRKHGIAKTEIPVFVPVHAHARVRTLAQPVKKAVALKIALTSSCYLLFFVAVICMHFLTTTHIATIGSH